TTVVLDYHARTSLLRIMSVVFDNARAVSNDFGTDLRNLIGAVAAVSVCGLRERGRWKGFLDGWSSQLWLDKSDSSPGSAFRHVKQLCDLGYAHVLLAQLLH